MSEDYWYIEAAIPMDMCNDYHQGECSRLKELYGLRPCSKETCIDRVIGLEQEDEEE